MDLLTGQITPVRDQKTCQPRERPPIASSFNECVKLIDELTSLSDMQNIIWTGSPVSLDAHASKLRAWGNDTGASSWALDHALRKASRLKQQVLLLLNVLKNELQTGIINLSSTVYHLSVLFGCTSTFSIGYNSLRLWLHN
jgi:hypothetical protein